MPEKTLNPNAPYRVRITRLASSTVYDYRIEVCDPNLVHSPRLIDFVIGNHSVAGDAGDRMVRQCQEMLKTRQEVADLEERMGKADEEAGTIVRPHSFRANSNKGGG